MNYKYLTKFLPVVVAGFLISGCTLLPNSSGNSSSTPTSTSYSTVNLSPTAKVSGTATTKPSTDNVVGLDTKYGQVVVKLYSKEASNTVVNFLNKVNSGFYKNLSFHRVEPGFVVQGGDPTGTGTGGGQIKSELNSLMFKRGSVGLARTPADKNISNDSQFFICLSTQSCSQLTGDYVNFGEVISGMDIVDQIKIGDKIIDITTKTK